MVMFSIPGFGRGVLWIYAKKSVKYVRIKVKCVKMSEKYVEIKAKYVKKSVKYVGIKVKYVKISVKYAGFNVFWVRWRIVNPLEFFSPFFFLIWFWEIGFFFLIFRSLLNGGVK